MFTAGNHLVDKQRARGRKPFTRQETNTRISFVSRGQMPTELLAVARSPRTLNRASSEALVTLVESRRDLPRTSGSLRLSPAYGCKVLRVRRFDPKQDPPCSMGSRNTGQNEARAAATTVQRKINDVRRITGKLIDPAPSYNFLLRLSSR